MTNIVEILSAQPANEIYFIRATIILLVIGLIALLFGILKARAKTLVGGIVCVFLSFLAVAYSAETTAARHTDQCEAVAQLFEAGKAETSKENKLIYLQKCGQPKYTEVFDIRLAK